MFTPHSLGIALMMMITSAICWGSWANTYKGVKNYRFELFYWDYAIGIFLISLIFAFTMAQQRSLRGHLQYCFSHGGRSDIQSG
jgi:glucose uptake protein